MKKFNLLVIIFILAGIIQTAKSQEEKSNAADMIVSADLMSRYIWRGTQFGGSSPSIQPNLALTYKGFEVGAWGAFSVGGVNFAQELDLYLSYTFVNKMVTVSFTDYFFPNESLDYKYFNYKKDETGHILEISASFNGTENLPLSFLVGINTWGADAIKLEDNQTSTDFNTKKGIQYSTYLELSYVTKINSYDLKPFIGATLNNPKKEDLTTGFIGETGFYGKSAGVVNLGLTAAKTIEFSDKFSLPMSISLITNPQAEKIHLVFGFTF